MWIWDFFFPSKKNNIDELPDDLIKVIISFLDLQSLGKCQQINMQWKNNINTFFSESSKTVISQHKFLPLLIYPLNVKDKYESFSSMTAEMQNKFAITSKISRLNIVFRAVKSERIFNRDHLPRVRYRQTLSKFITRFDPSKKLSSEENLKSVYQNAHIVVVSPFYKSDLYPALEEIKLYATQLVYPPICVVRESFLRYEPEIQEELLKLNVTLCLITGAFPIMHNLIDSENIETALLNMIDKKIVHFFSNYEPENDSNICILKK